MSAEQNKVLMQHLFNDVFNGGDLAALDGLCAPGLILEAPGIPTGRGRSEGLAAFKEWINTFRAAFPDIRYAIMDTIAEDSMIAVDFSLTGTQRGPYQGIAPTGRSVTGTEQCFAYVSDGTFRRLRFSPYGTPIIQQLRS
jgi:predicted ester cyclase